MGNTLLLSYFVSKDELGAARVQSIGAVSNLVVLGQVGAEAADLLTKDIVCIFMSASQSKRCCQLLMDYRMMFFMSAATQLCWALCLHCCLFGTL